MWPASFICDQMEQYLTHLWPDWWIKSLVVRLKISYPTKEREKNVKMWPVCHLWPNSDSCDQMMTFVTRYAQVWPEIITSDQIMTILGDQSVTRCDQLWPFVTSHVTLWEMAKNHVFGHISAPDCARMVKIPQKMRNRAVVQHVKYLSDISRYKIARFQKLIFLY